MLTQCPECETAFRITGAILRAANGQVRCGRCRTQFDALDRLLDDEGNPLARFEHASLLDELTPSDTRSNFIVEEPPAQEEITLEGKRIEITGTYRALEDDGTSYNAGEVVQQSYVIESEVPDEPDAGAWLNEDEDEQKHEQQERLASEAEEELESSASEEAPGSQPPAHESTSQMRARRIAEEDAEMLRAAGGPPLPSSASHNATASIDVPSPAPIAIDDNLDLWPTPERSKRPVATVWKIVLAPLALLLVAQIIHHERADLARHPTFGPPLQRVYSALGLAIDPNWNVGAYELQQRGVIADPAAPGTLTVRASIKNGAQFAQPYPLLKLVLEDRWGNPVRARAFTPQEYTVIADPQALMTPGQRTEARIAIADPGREAEGFRFDLCLQRATGVICAEEMPDSAASK